MTPRAPAARQGDAASTWRKVGNATDRIGWAIRYAVRRTAFWRKHRPKWLDWEARGLALRAEEPDEALRLFRKVLAQQPERSGLLRVCGRLHVKLGEHEAARPYWERLVALGAADCEPHLQLARIHDRAGRHKDCIAETARVLAFEPDHAEAQRLQSRHAAHELDEILSAADFDDAAIRQRTDFLQGTLSDASFGSRIEALKTRAGGAALGEVTQQELPLQTVAPARSRRHGAANGPPSAAQLIAAAEGYTGAGDVKFLIETLETLVGVAGPQPEVLALLAGKRTFIQAALAEGAANLESGAHALLALRAMRLLDVSRHAATPRQRAISIDDDEEDAEPTDAFTADTHQLIAAAEEHVRNGYVASLISTLENLVGMAGPRPEVLAVIADTRTFIEAATGHGGDRDGAAQALAMRGQRLVNFLSAPPDAAALATRQPETREAQLDLPGLNESAIEIWRAAQKAVPADLSKGLGLLRAMDAAGEHHALLDELARIMSAAPPFAELSSQNQKCLVEMLRIVVRRDLRQARSEQFDALRAMVQRNAPSALVCWFLGIMELMRHERVAALGYLNEALTHPAPPAEVAIDLHAERALLFIRYHMFGEALDAMAQVNDGARRTVSQRRAMKLTDEVAAFCASAQKPLRYPECLVDVIVEERLRAPPKYQPIPRHVAMVSSSLGQGGGERQSITVINRMVADARVAGLSFLVRSTHLHPEDGFFLPLVQTLPLDLVVYGEDWYRRSHAAAVLPELRDRPRLLRAIDLLPNTLREDIIRVCRLLYDKRPQAVHIWQDLPGPALACFIVGVPRYLVRRGSLSPDQWEYNERQLQTHIRPMRHIYRRLLDDPGFSILNNSAEGSRTDKAWTQWDDPAPFKVLHNAVNFETLGPAAERNMALRQSLGIADDAPVIGSAFRFVEVKRPDYWIEAASGVAAAFPDAHFIIIGDGPLIEPARHQADALGLADRLHLPGRIADVGDWYRAMDMVLLTSSREGAPNVLIEAQHFGVPVVATDVGGIREVMAVGRSGFVVPGTTPAEFADQAIAALRDPAWRAAARQAGPQYVHDTFSLDSIVDQLVAHYGIGEDGRQAPSTRLSAAVHP